MADKDCFSSRETCLGIREDGASSVCERSGRQRPFKTASLTDGSQLDTKCYVGSRTNLDVCCGTTQSTGGVFHHPKIKSESLNRRFLVKEVMNLRFP